MPPARTTHHRAVAPLANAFHHFLVGKDTLAGGAPVYRHLLFVGQTDLDYIERVKIQQKNWIGRSTGAEVTFTATTGDDIVVFTTRPDTLFGATYMVLSPEHELVKKWTR